MKKLLIIFVVLFASYQFAGAADPQQLLKEIDRNLNPESYESYRKIVNIEPDGKKKEYVLFSVKKGTDKMIAIFTAPASDKGRSTLRLGDNMWLYVPNVGKPIRITSLQSIIGGVFNNSDILSLDYSAEYNVEKMESVKNEYILELKAKSKTVAYDRIKIWADKEKKIPVKIECMTEKKMLIKTLNFKKITDFGDGIVRPAVVETVSPLYKDYKSVMIYSKIKKRVVKDEVFSLTFMPRAESLR